MKMKEEVTHFKNFRIEKLSKETTKDVALLFKIVFNSKTSEETINNKHINCNGDHKFIGYIAYDNESNIPVAYYAVYPRYMIHKGQTFLGAQSGDTMANPNFKRKGIFAQLAELTFEHCEKIGIDIVTGFPNKFSYLTFIKNLKFNELEKLGELEFIQNKFEIHRITNKNSFLKTVHIKYIRLLFSLLFRKGVSFQNSNKNNKELTYVVHDDKYFSLKNHENKVLISIKGVNVLLKLHYEINQIEIGDIDSTQETELTKIISTLRLATRLSGLRFLNFQSTKNSFLYPRLKPTSKSQKDVSTFIIKDLTGKVSFDTVSLLICDSDGF
jgi:penicillin-binding protein-related factor A (putative recombinase)